MKPTPLFKPNGEFNGSIGVGKYNIPTSAKMPSPIKEKLVEKVRADDARGRESGKPFNSWSLYWENYAKKADETIDVAWSHTKDIRWYRDKDSRVQAIQIGYNPYWVAQWLRMNGYDALAIVSSIDILNRVKTDPEVYITGADGSKTVLKLDEWLVKSSTGEFLICQDEVFRKEYLSEGVKILFDYTASQDYYWEQAQVGKTLDGKIWFRQGGGDSINDIEDFDWEPLVDISQIHQGVSFYVNRSNEHLASKATFIANAQGLLS